MERALLCRIFSSVLYVQPNTQHKTDDKNNQRYIVYQLVTKIPARKFQQQEVDVGIRTVMVAQRFPHIPMPVGAEAIAPTIPDTQHKPGARCEQHGDQVKLSCFGKYPAHDIENREGRMKDEEKGIKEGIPHDAAVLL